MASPDKNYRENPERAIYLTGEIDQQLVDRISPAINEFRLESTDPITVYVDSPGGSITLAETVLYHLQAPNPDGMRCRVITVVTARASSAAADFVALGDYAIAYPYASLVYHGTRRPADSYLTMEMARAWARDLQRTNERFAVRLARHAFSRFLVRLSQFEDEFDQYINGAADLSVLTQGLQQKLSSGNAALVREALAKQSLVDALGGAVVSHLRRLRGGGKALSASQFEAEMLRAVVRFKVKAYRGKPWYLSRSGLQEVTDEFNLLHDFHFGEHRAGFDTWHRTYGDLVLSDAEKAEQAVLRGDNEARSRWLMERSIPRLRPIWYLLLSICRSLQGADFVLSAAEAYWLGLIDEAPGSGLPCIRTAAERGPVLAQAA